MEGRTSSDANGAVDILLKEYEHRFTEIATCSQRFRKQADFLNLFLTSVLAIAALIFADKTRGLLGSFSMLNGKDLNVLYCGFLVFAPLFLFHLYASIMEALCLIRLNGERLAAIEIQINERSGEKLLIWEHQAVPHFFKQMRVRGWIKPNALAGLWMFLIFIFLCASFCVLAFKLVPFFSYVYIPLMICLTVFHIWQWILMLTTGFESIHSYFHPPVPVTIKKSHRAT